MYNWDYEKTGTHDYWDATASYKTMWDIMSQVAPGKMHALTECQALPNPAKMASGDPNFAKWLYALPWWANTNDNPSAWVKTSYTDPFVINMDQLPSNPIINGDDLVQSAARDGIEIRKTTNGVMVILPDVQKNNQSASIIIYNVNGKLLQRISHADRSNLIKWMNKGLHIIKLENPDGSALIRKINF